MSSKGAPYLVLFNAAQFQRLLHLSVPAQQMRVQQHQLQLCMALPCPPLLTRCCGLLSKHPLRMLPQTSRQPLFPSSLRRSCLGRLRCPVGLVPRKMLLRLLRRQGRLQGTSSPCGRLGVRCLGVSGNLPNLTCTIPGMPAHSRFFPWRCWNSSILLRIDLSTACRRWLG